MSSALVQRLVKKKILSGKRRVGHTEEALLFYRRHTGEDVSHHRVERRVIPQMACSREHIMDSLPNGFYHVGIAGSVDKIRSLCQRGLDQHRCQRPKVETPHIDMRRILGLEDVESTESVWPEVRHHSKCT